MWNMRRRHSSHGCQPAAAEPSVKADHREPRQRSERNGEPLRTAERRLRARERAGMPVPGSCLVISTGSPTASRRLLPQEPPPVCFVVNRCTLNRFPPQEPSATLQHPSRGDVSPLLPMPKAALFLNLATSYQYAVGDGTNLGNAASSGYCSTKEDATLILHSSSLRLIQTSIARLRTATARLMSQ